MLLSIFAVSILDCIVIADILFNIQISLGYLKCNKSHVMVCYYHSRDNSFSFSTSWKGVSFIYLRIPNYYLMLYMLLFILMTLFWEFLDKHVHLMVKENFNVLPIFELVFNNLENAWFQIIKSSFKDRRCLRVSLNHRNLKYHNGFLFTGLWKHLFTP